MQDRNVEVTMEVCDSGGNVLPGVLSMGPGSSTSNRFNAIVYRHEAKPRWNEVVKILLPGHEYGECHIRFSFTHRSRQDKYNPPYAMSYVKLNTEEGTTILDKDHRLAVYRIGNKVEVRNNPFYLTMSSHKESVSDKDKKDNGLTFIKGDVFVINTILASTQLTQNEGVLALLRWRECNGDPKRLERECLNKIIKINMQEFVKQMPEVLDALFLILYENEDNIQLDKKVFKALVELILGIIEEKSQFQHFIPALESYIEDTFYHAKSYKKILEVLREEFEDFENNLRHFDHITICLRYIFKFVVRSKQLANETQLDGEEEFEEDLRSVFGQIIKIMHMQTSDKSRALYNRCQRDCLKQMVLSLPDLNKVYQDTELSMHMLNMIDALPEDDQLNISKVEAIKDLVHSPLFPKLECRKKLLPSMATHIQESLTKGPKVVKAATEALGEILDVLNNGIERNESDMDELMVKCLRTLIHKVANRSYIIDETDETTKKADETTKQAVVTNLICLLHQMNNKNYESYVRYIVQDQSPYVSRQCRIDFVMEILNLFEDLIENNVFPDSWNSMIMLQNSVIMKVLSFIAHTIRDHFSSGENFERDAWSSFFRCSIFFIKQKSLQLENFSENKRLKIAKSYEHDMRKVLGLEVRQMWFNLGKEKIIFVNEPEVNLIGDFLELALIKDEKRELMRNTIEIFFDMIQCEYYSPRFLNKSSESLNNPAAEKGDFKEFQREFITQLDIAIAKKGLGDDYFLQRYERIMTSKCKQHTALCESGTKYVETTSKLIKLLLDYRDSRTDSKENQMSCIVNLLYFYQDIQRDDLYSDYIRELADLHKKSLNFTEAGFCLLRYARGLEWSHQPLQFSWGQKYSHCSTQSELKEALYKEIIDLFDKGKMWEEALKICEELGSQYKNEIFDYGKLSEIYQKMSTFYSFILNTNEAKRMPEYFRVSYIGKGFPAFLQNQTFIFRGRGCDKLDEFDAKILEQWNNAEKMKTLDPPTQEQMDGFELKIQICKVDPILDEETTIWKDKSPVSAPQIVKYYQKNQVKRFSYDKPNKRGPKGINEHANLWIKRTIYETRETFPTILESLPVQNESIVELTPIEVATMNMNKSNSYLEMVIQEHGDRLNGEKADFKTLSGLLNGQISKCQRQEIFKCYFFHSF